MNFKEIADVVEKWTQEVFDAIQDNARRDFKSKSNALAQSASVYEKSLIAKKITYQILIDDYYRFIDEGVHGVESSYLQSRSSRYRFRNKFVGRRMRMAISRWIKNAGVKSFPKSGGTRISQLRSVAKQKDQLSFIIAKGIKKKGIKATQFFSKAITPEKIKELETKLTDVMGKKITLDLTKMIEDK